MVDATTTNVLLTVPARGNDPGTWDVPVNSNSNAIDGFLGGVQIISASNAPITLTAPSGVVSPTAGPTQAQNAVLRITGTLSGNVQVTLPMPGYFIIENATTGNFVLSFRAIGAGAVIAFDQGETQHIYNDGTNVKFVNLGRVAEITIWAGLSAMPTWVGACTVPPYLLCDGSIYSFSTYPNLGKRLLASFGGNGSTTFGVPDLRGRMALPYDGTGTRITAGGCGLNGQTLGASLDQQLQVLSVTQLPTNITSVGTNTVTVFPSGNSANFVPYSITGWTIVNTSNTGGGSIAPQEIAPAPGIGNANSFSGSNTTAVVSNNTGGSGHPNVQPSQVTGISVIRAA